MDVTVGQVIWGVKPDYRGRKMCEPFEMTVTKIGKKYFYTNKGRFHLSNGVEEAGDNSNYLISAYFTNQEILDNIEMVDLIGKMRTFFSYSASSKNLTLTMLRDIDKIINK